MGGKKLSDYIVYFKYAVFYVCVCSVILYERPNDSRT